MDNEFYFTDEVVGYFDSVDSYVRNLDEGYEKIKLGVPSDDYFSIDVGFLDDSALVSFETNIDFEPVLNVLDSKYPPSRDDKMFVSNSMGFGERSIGEGFGNDIDVFEFNRSRDPRFELSWIMGYNEELDTDLPFVFNLEVRDSLGISLDRESISPFADFVPVMLRDDIDENVSGKLLYDFLQLLDYGANGSESNIMAYDFEQEEYASLIKESARTFDEYRFNE